MKAMQSRVEPIAEGQTVEPGSRLALTPNSLITNSVNKAANEAADTQVIPDPQVRQQPQRRRFTADYKLRIIEEADRCSSPGQVGAILRREGLYSSHLVTWRRQRKEGSLEALSSRKRGPKTEAHSPLADEVEKLRRENEQLRDRLSQAETIIDVQKKVSLLLASPLPQSTGRS